MELTDRETHFDFGKNWQSLVDGLTARQIDEAVNGLRRPFPELALGDTAIIGCLRHGQIVLARQQEADLCIRSRHHRLSSARLAPRYKSHRRQKSSPVSSWYGLSGGRLSVFSLMSNVALNCLCTF